MRSDIVVGCRRPLMIVGLVVGVVVSLFQALTQQNPGTTMGSCRKSWQSSLPVCLPRLPLYGGIAAQSHDAESSRIIGG